ncbi:hypothetical protein MNBD_NITROSPINAE02-1887 [hydrothermal vent metagenome]|uniref:SPOR domain-containing protein n=1 Tax=hydrothermal vent metagenome TaxID=652676 RepID=A0A3B1D1S7_9ZZZZ
MKDYKQSRISVTNRRLRIVVMAIVSIGLFSFVLGYWAANWFFSAERSPVKTETSEEAPILGAIPKKLDANQIINETEVVEVPKEALKKNEEKFTFTKTLKKESAPAVDPFENQKPAPVTAPKKKEDKKEKKAVKKKKEPAKKQIKKQVKKPVKKKKVASANVPKGKVFTVQVGSFVTEKDAVNLRKALVKKGYSALISRAVVRGKTWRRVQVGSFKTRGAAERIALKLKNKEKLPTFIVSVKR